MWCLLVLFCFPLGLLLFGYCLFKLMFVVVSVCEFGFDVKLWLQFDLTVMLWALVWLFSFLLFGLLFCFCGCGDLMLFGFTVRCFAFVVNLGLVCV